MIGFSDPDTSDGRLVDHDGVRRRRGLDPLRAGLQLPLVILDPRRPQDRCHHGEPVWFALLLFSWRTQYALIGNQPINGTSWPCIVTIKKNIDLKKKNCL